MAVRGRQFRSEHQPNNRVRDYVYEYASKGVLKSPFKQRCVTRVGIPVLKASEFGDSDYHHL